MTEYPRAKAGDEVTVRDHPGGHPVVNGRPLQLYDRVAVHEYPSGEVVTKTVTDMRVRCWGKPGREQRWGGTVNDQVGQRDRWFDEPVEQVWITLDDTAQIWYADEIIEVLL